MGQMHTDSITNRQRFWRYRCLKHKKNILIMLISIAVVAFLITDVCLIHAQNIYVTKSGCFAPTGESSAPYHMVESGIAKAKMIPGSTVLIGPGKYYETFMVNSKVTLKSSGGTVIIGKNDYQASTSLELLTLNTHLCGNVHFCPFLNDWERGEDISYYIRDELNNSPDVVCFQEIWDDDIFLGLSGDAEGEGICKRAGYPYGYHGTQINCPGCWNSGLAVMSWHPMANWQQYFWHWTVFLTPGYCCGWDCMASKGFVQTEIEKDGFKIWIVNLHTDADEDICDRQARKKQLTWLRSHLIEMRHLDAYRSYVFFVMGDFNVYDHKDQYRKFLVNLLGDEEAGGRDADRNSPGFVIGNPEQQTFSRDNPLAIHWDGDYPSGRLDYIIYIPSADGTVEVMPMDVNVVHFRGRDLLACVDGSIIACNEWKWTNELSDHWAVRGQFKLIRK